MFNLKEAFYQSKCPKCGNVDILNEEETKKEVHCQRCYHHYKYKKGLYFKGYKTPFFRHR